MFKKIFIISMLLVSLFGVTVFAYSNDESYPGVNDSHKYYVHYYFDYQGARYEKVITYDKSEAIYLAGAGDVVFVSPSQTYVYNGSKWEKERYSSSSYFSRDYYYNIVSTNDSRIFELFEQVGQEVGKPSVPDDNFLNTIKINNLKDDIKVTGYLTGTSPLKWYDIEVYGKFVNDSGILVNPSLLKTYIINNTIVWHGDEKRRMGEGLGSKSFSWIKEPSGKGTIGEFRMVVTMPMLKEGFHDVTVGTTINLNPDVSTYAYTWLTDTVKNVEFLGDNYEDNFDKPPVEVPNGGTSGQVGGVGGDGVVDIPQPPEDGTIIDWLKYFFEVILWLVTYPFILLGQIIGTLLDYIIDLFKILAPVGEYLKSVLSFIPTDIMNVLWGILSFSILFSAIKMITGYMRGR